MTWSREVGMLGLCFNPLFSVPVWFSSSATVATIFATLASFPSFNISSALPARRPRFESPVHSAHAVDLVTPRVVKLTLVRGETQYRSGSSPLLSASYSFQFFLCICQEAILRKKKHREWSQHPVRERRHKISHSRFKVNWPMLLACDALPGTLRSTFSSSVSFPCRNRFRSRDVDASP